MKNTSYQLLYKQAQALIADEPDLIANMANLAALVYHNVEDLNWVGFYFLRGEHLVLGPFSGQVACTRIALGQGVCGAALASQTTQVVSDVHEFPGHIACDAASESELVVPFNAMGFQCVFDVDSPILSRFSADEVDLFEQLATLIEQHHQV
jgi:L-methionine (R)-S-oxide reductase